MTYKQIEASREVRLWIGQVIVPAIGVASAVVLSNPDLRKAASEKVDDMKQTIRRRKTRAL